MTSTAEKILCVDDDPNILEGFRRQLRKRFHIETALGGEEGLSAITNHGPFALVVTDMRMPGMNGIQFLTKLEEVSPQTVRMMLTGNADLQTAIDAVNEGHIFRFLSKPCSPDQLAKALEAGLTQYRLIHSEKELLEQTLQGSIRALMDVLALVNPEAFGRSSRIQRHVKQLAKHLKVPDGWRCELGAMVSQIGCVILPEKLLRKLYKGQELSPDETQMFNQHPCTGADLLAHIPRMKEVADIIMYQEKHYDGGGVPHDSVQGDAIPLGARLLKVALDFDALETAGLPKAEALFMLQQRTGWYDPSVLAAFNQVLSRELRYMLREVKAGDLKTGMIFAEEVRTESGVLLLAKGQETTSSLIARLHNFVGMGHITKPLRVLVPITVITDDG